MNEKKLIKYMILTYVFWLVLVLIMLLVSILRSDVLAGTNITDGLLYSILSLFEAFFLSTIIVIFK